MNSNNGINGSGTGTAVTFGDAHHLSSSLFGGPGHNAPATPSDGVPTPSEWRGGVSMNSGGGPSPRRTGGDGNKANSTYRRSALGGGERGAALTNAAESETGGGAGGLSARDALLPPPPRGGSPLESNDGGGGLGPASVSASDAGGAAAGNAAARRRLSAATAAARQAELAAAAAAAASSSPSPFSAAAAPPFLPPRRTTNGSSQTEYDLRMQQLYRQQQQQRQLRGGGQAFSSSSSVPPSLATGAAAGVAPSTGATGIPLPPPSHAVTSADDMAKEGALIEAAVGGGGGGAAEASKGNAASGGDNNNASSSSSGAAPPPNPEEDEGGNAANAAASQAAYCRVITPEPAPSEEAEDVCALLRECLELRAKWLFTPATPPEKRPHAPEAAAPSEVVGAPPPFEWGQNEPGPAPFVAEMVGGVMHVYEKIYDGGEGEEGSGGGAGNGNDETSSSSPKHSPTTATNAAETTPLPPRPQPPKRGRRVFSPPGDANAFFADLHRVLKIAALGPVKSFAHHRLVLLEQRFNLHVMLNADKEFLAQKSAPHRDFYNVRKVDTHVHHSACMHQKHLLRFMKSKLRKEPDEVVIFRDGKYLTLAEVFESLRLTAHSLNVDALDMHADKGTFHRFDRFNLKYNPFGQARLREVFIKQDNLIRGRFLAELTKEVFVDLEASKYQHAEYRVSIYGRKRVEWDTLAAWVLNNGLYSDNGERRRGGDGESFLFIFRAPKKSHKKDSFLFSFVLSLSLFLPLFQ